MDDDKKEESQPGAGIAMSVGLPEEFTRAEWDALYASRERLRAEAAHLREQRNSARSALRVAEEVVTRLHAQATDPRLVAWQAWPRKHIVRAWLLAEHEGESKLRREACDLAAAALEAIGDR